MKIVFFDLFKMEVMTTLDLQNTLYKIIKGHDQVWTFLLWLQDYALTVFEIIEDPISEIIIIGPVRTKDLQNQYEIMHK